MKRHHQAGEARPTPSRAARNPLWALALLAVLPAVAACSGCHRAAEAPAPRVRHSTDLRALALLLLPEYRGVAIHTAHGELTRTVAGPADFRALMERTLASSGFVSDGGAAGLRPPFVMSLAREGETADFKVAFDLAPGKFADMVQVPVPLTTMDLGMMMPRGLKVVEEHFRFVLEWESTSETHAAQVARLDADLWVSNGQWAPRALPEGWAPKPEGKGFGAVPETFTVTFDGKVDGAVIELSKKGTSARLVYTLDTDVPAR